MVINIHSLIKNSRVNGPGDRFVIWTQGCRKGCKNCYNPETWSHYKNNLIPIDEISSGSDISGSTYKFTSSYTNGDLVRI